MRAAHAIVKQIHRTLSIYMHGVLKTAFLNRSRFHQDALFHTFPPTL